MNDDLQHLFAIARRHASLARKIVDALKARFDEAQPEALLTLEHLTDAEQTEQAVTALAALGVLTETHRRAFRRVLEAFAKESAALRQATPAVAPASASLPGVVGLMEAFELEMRGHALFLERTQEWVDAAQALCRVIDSARGALTFHDEGIVFEGELERQRYEELLAQIASIERVNAQQELEESVRRAQFESRVAQEMPSLFTGPISG